MRARDLAEDLPTVDPGDSAWHAVRILVAHRLPGIAVVDRDGHAEAVLPASRVLKAIIPSYVQDDPSLARVLDEDSADRLCTDDLGHKTVRDLLPAGKHRVELAKVDGDATVMECAAEMARLVSPLLVVVDGGQRARPAHRDPAAAGAAAARRARRSGQHEVAQPHVPARHQQRGPGDHQAVAGELPERDR